MDWCNVNEAGFGVRPTSSTGDANTDAFVWVKPGGESDGTSNPNSYYYDSFCGKADGLWNCSLLTIYYLLRAYFSFQARS